MGVTVHRVDATPPQRILSLGTTEPMMVPCGFGFRSNCFLITTRFPAEYTGRLEPQLKSEKRRKEVGESAPEPSANWALTVTNWAEALREYSRKARKGRSFFTEKS